MSRTAQLTLPSVWLLVLGLGSLVLKFAGPDAQAQVLTRGPYLQSGTESSIVVRWRTDLPTDSRVSFGAAPGALNFIAEDAGSRTEHEVFLPGLLPDTRYFYAVGSTTARLAGGDTNHWFITAPPPGTAKPTRVWAIGDFGTQLPGQIAVRDAYASYTGPRPTDLWLMLGDNAYYYGTDLEYQLGVFNIYTNLLRQVVAWPTLGNHDTYSVESTGNHAYFDIFTLPTDGRAGGVASGTEHYYSFDYGRVHFICLDSMESSRSPTGPMAQWLTNDLAHANADWIIAYCHHPPYSRGSHDSDVESELILMRENIVPLLEQGGVDLVLSGHSHSYERSALLDGHYGYSAGMSPTNRINGGDGRDNGAGAYHKPRGGPVAHYGTVYAVVGSSGWATGGQLNHPAMQVSLNQLGSLVLDITSNRLDATFLRENGATNDWFTLLKVYQPPVATPLTVNVDGDLPAALGLAGHDPAGLPMTFSTHAAPSQGLMTLCNSLTGIATYLPAHGYVGPDEFSYRTFNGFLRSAPATVAINVLAPADANTNGLPDYWETRFGVAAADADADGDGYSNWSEYLANTNPTNATSALRITGVTLAAGDQCTLRWQAAGQTRYRVSYRDGNPVGAFTDIVRPVAQELCLAPTGAATVQEFADSRQFTPAPVGGARFYRVRAVR